MTMEEIDIAQLFNVPCKVTINGNEYNGIYKITHLIRFYDSKLKRWKITANMCDSKYPNYNFTAALNEIRAVEGWDLFIAEKLKQLKDKEIYEKCKDKLMCRKGIG